LQPSYQFFESQPSFYTVSKGGGTITLKSPTPEKKLEKQSTVSIPTPEVIRAGFEPKRFESQISSELQHPQNLLFLSFKCLVFVQEVKGDKHEVANKNCKL
jgi:hypothetical protein